MERFNATLADAVSQYTQGNQQRWDEVVPFVTAAYNSATYSSTKESPFYLMFRRDPQTPLETVLHHDVSIYKEEEELTDTIALNMQLAWKVAAKNAQLAREKHTQKYNENSYKLSVAVGDRVFIRDIQTKKGTSGKLNYSFRGPYRVQMVENSKVLLTSIIKHMAKPFCWHKDYLKLTRLVDPQQVESPKIQEVVKQQRYELRSTRQPTTEAGIPQE